MKFHHFGPLEKFVWLPVDKSANAPLPGKNPSDAHALEQW